MKEELIEENLELIATRIPPGDQWKLLTTGETVQGLVQTLNQYVRQKSFKGHYRLEPLNGKLYAIYTTEVAPPEPEKFDLYGEF
jgi:hypothetical protein